MSGDPYASFADPVQASQPNAVAQGAYPAPSGYTPTPAQSLTAWQLYNSGSLKPDQKPGSPAYPRFADPQHPPQAGDAVIDQGGNFRVAGQGDNGADPYAAFSDPRDAPEPAMGAAEDAARTVPGALGRSFASMAGLPGDVLNLGVNVPFWLVHKLGADGEKGAYQPIDFASAHGYGTSQTENQALQDTFGDYHTPQTALGRFTDTAVQMAPAALAPGGPLVSTARVLVPAIASDVAGEVARKTAPGNPTAEAWARALGALGGGGAEGLGESAYNAPLMLASKGLEGVTPAHLDQMQGLMTKAQGMGVNLTPAEALTQVGAGRLAPLQHYVENSHVGGPQMSEFFAARPDQVSGAVGNFADTIAPHTDQPSMIGAQAQAAAQGGLDQIRQGINAQAQPFYDALRDEQMGPIFSGVLQKNPSYRGALSSLRANPELNGPISDLPNGNLAVVNETVKKLDADIAAATPGPNNPTGNHQLVGLRQGARSDADLLASIVSDNWRQARDTVAQGRSALLDPLDAGPTGAIARTDSVPSQTAALYPAKPIEGAPNETMQAIRLMNGQDPDVAAALTRQHLMNSFNESSQDLIGGQNQYGGAKWIAQIAGNPEQRATLQAGLGELNPQAADQFGDLSDVLAATGKRMQPGSQTAFNEERAKAFSMTPAASRALHFLDPLEWGSLIDKGVGGAMYRRNISSLAYALQASPEDARAFLQKAQQVSGGNPGLALAITAHGGANQ